eukprot:5545739-Amphidinium_carterae.1
MDAMPEHIKLVSWTHTHTHKTSQLDLAAGESLRQSGVPQVQHLRGLRATALQRLNGLRSSHHSNRHVNVVIAFKTITQFAGLAITPILRMRGTLPAETLSSEAQPDHTQFLASHVGVDYQPVGVDYQQVRTRREAKI